MVPDDLRSRLGTARWALDALPKNALRGAAYLDVGCGVGNALVVAAERGAKTVCGIDIAPPGREFFAEMADRGLAHCHAEVIAGDVLSYNFARTFDVVSVIDAIEHLASPALSVQRCADLLAPGGLLLIAGGGLYYSQMGHHLWQWWPGATMPWRHLWKEPPNPEGITDPWFWEEFQKLNKITLAGIRESCRLAGLVEEGIFINRTGEDRFAALVERIDMGKVPDKEDLFIEGLSLVCRKH